MSSDLALPDRPHGTPERRRGIVAREAVSSGLASSASGNCQAAQARATNPERRRTYKENAASREAAYPGRDLVPVAQSSAHPSPATVTSYGPVIKTRAEEPDKV